jgi:uncharacterized protein YjbI with pentapeptide repeats
LTDVKLCQANLANAEMSSAILMDTDLTGATLPDGSTQP